VLLIAAAQLTLGIRWDERSANLLEKRFWASFWSRYLDFFTISSTSRTVEPGLYMPKISRSLVLFELLFLHQATWAGATSLGLTAMHA
jgi:hypothetical protein